jgi:predicted DsbA family dithiol-disulfide isomerase
MATLLFYHDFNSAFCRLALGPARAAAAAAGVALEAVPFELYPAPAPLPDPAAALAAEVEAVRGMAAEQGVPLVLPGRVARTRKAHEAVAHARGQGREAAMLDALYDAVWRRGLDPGRIDVLVELAAAAGLDPGPLHVALGLDAHAPGVVRAQELAEAAGIAGVPAYRVGDDVTAGLLARDDLLAWIRDRL